MDPEVTQLMAENLPKNFVDPRAYPSVSQIEKKCIQILAKLYHCPAVENKLPVGVSTVGSSEAIMLAVLAMKVQWANRQHASGNHSKPNIIISSAAHVCWKKAALYFEVDVQYVQCSENRYVLDPIRAVDLVNDRTIGICCILGTTYTGEYEDVKAVNDLLIEGGHDVPIHVDAASGGFVAPFVAPDLQWDFRLEKVASINVSGHKYGLVYPGIGWALWRSPEKLPASLVFYLSYLGASQSSFTLNFSKSSSHVIAQYHQFIRLGRAGYRSFIHGIMKEASCLEKSLKSMGLWILSKPDGIQGIPVVAFRVGHALSFKFDEFELSAELERRGWLVPAYHMADGASHVTLLRIVCRVDFTCELREQLLRDMKLSLETLQRQ
ncbi:Glutamate decarboxylase [Penicillium longicatenatum]|nr:Glutamate decarboxylase [Penicillium longicatenatum]